MKCAILLLRGEVFFEGIAMVVINKGFTLIEALVVLAMISIVLSLASPNFFETIRRNKVNSAADNLYSLIRYARAEAVRGGNSINIGALDGVSWSSGAMVWREVDNTAGFDPANDTEIRRIDGSEGVVITEAAANINIQFNGEGYITAPVALSICDGRTTNGRSINILVSGFSALANKVDC